MKVRELAERFGLQTVSGSKGLDRHVRDGYCGDLLSDVMANAPAGCVWLTIQGHQNIVAVALLREMAAVVITGGQQPEPATVHWSEKEGIPLLLTPASAFELAGRLWEAGVNHSDGERK